MRELQWTDESEGHIWDGHRVRPSEVEEVIYTRPRYTRPSRDDTDLVFGTTDAGRYLMVVLADAPDGRLSVVTARDMTSTERRTFARRGQ